MIHFADNSMSKIKNYLNGLREKILWFKYRKRPYIEYYRAVMKYRTAENPKTATGGGWNETGPMQLERLKRYGMRPEHTLFDFGCGTLRGGQHLITYLNPNNYFGNDISAEILNEARKLIKKQELDVKNPHLFLTNNLLFDEVAGKQFDYIHAQSVLSHMPPEDIEELFKQVKKIMHPKTIFLATFFLSRDGTIYPGNNMKNFSYPLEWMEKTGKKHGLKVEMVETDRKQKLIKITL